MQIGLIMRKISIFVKALVINSLILIFPVSAFDDPPTIHGYGIKSCADYLEAERDTTLGKVKSTEKDGKLYGEIKLGFISWTLGFISGRNTACRDIQLNNKIDESFDSWMREHCEMFPKKPYATAVEAYLADQGVWKSCGNLSGSLASQQ